MSWIPATSVLAVLLLVAIVAAIVARRGRARLARRIRALNDELVAASADASVGRRLSIHDDADSAAFASNINRLFDAVDERDQKIQGRDRLFRDFAKTLPEIVVIHDEKILLANESAASLVGLEPATRRS